MKKKIYTRYERVFSCLFYFVEENLTKWSGIIERNDALKKMRTAIVPIF